MSFNYVLNCLRGFCRFNQIKNDDEEEKKNENGKQVLLHDT